MPFETTNMIFCLFLCQLFQPLITLIQMRNQLNVMSYIDLLYILLISQTFHSLSRLHLPYSRFWWGENSPYWMQRKMLRMMSSAYLHYSKAPKNVLMLMIHQRNMSARWVTFEYIYIHFTLKRSGDIKVARCES